MLTKTVSATIVPSRDERVECEKCHSLVPISDIVPFNGKKLCLGCYNIQKEH